MGASAPSFLQVIPVMRVPLPPAPSLDARSCASDGPEPISAQPPMRTSLLAEQINALQCPEVDPHDANAIERARPRSSTRESYVSESPSFGCKERASSHPPRQSNAADTYLPAAPTTCGATSGYFGQRESIDADQGRQSLASEHGRARLRTVGFSDGQQEHFFSDSLSQSEADMSECRSEWWEPSVASSRRRGSSDARGSTLSGWPGLYHEPPRGSTMSIPGGGADGEDSSERPDTEEEHKRRESFEETARLRADSVPAAPAKVPDLSDRFDTRAVAERRTKAAEVLGVSKNAGKKTVTNAFREVARDYHPDKGGDKANFQILNEARMKLLAQANAACRRGSS